MLPLLLVGAAMGGSYLVVKKRGGLSPAALATPAATSVPATPPVSTQDQSGTGASASPKPTPPLPSPAIVQQQLNDVQYFNPPDQPGNVAYNKKVGDYQAAQVAAVAYASQINYNREFPNNQVHPVPPTQAQLALLAAPPPTP